jgi:hypothetical protein
VPGAGEWERQEAVEKCKGGKVERWTRKGVGCQVPGDGDWKRQEAVGKCKGAKVEKWKLVGEWTSGLVGGADAKRKVAGAIGKGGFIRHSQK